jgi:hypothetical protein
MKKAALFLVLAFMFGMINAQTKVEIKPKDLSKVITDNIAKDYVGFTIDKAYKVTKDKVVSYEVIVMKGSEHQKLLYDAAGKFTKKEALIAEKPKENTEKPKAKTEPKTEPKTQQK